MKTFKDYNETPAVSFDFDDTIFMLKWDKENNDYMRDEKGHPVGKLNTDIAKKIKKYKSEGYKVYVITSRRDNWRDETEEFLADNKLMQYIDDVIFTNGAYKANICKRYGVKVHYDDDMRELHRLKHKGIDGVRVHNEII